MKKLFLSAVVVSALILSSCAGGGHGHGAKMASGSGMDGKAMVEMMDGALDLSEDQEKTLIRLYDEFNAETKDLDKEEVKVKMQEMSKKVMDVLDEDQKVIFQGFMKMHRSMGASKSSK